jgi:hypothetical protein
MKKGGKREGAGRPKKEPSKTIQIRVPTSRYEELKEVARKAVEEKLEAP